MNFVWSLKNLIEVLVGWQENKFDGLIVIDGRRGLGKSTLAVNTAFRFPQFKLKRDVLFSRREIMHSLSKSKYKIIVADEMINVTYNRDFYAEEQKKLLKMLNMYRDSCNILIACVPNFYDLDKQFRALCKMRLNVVRRGLAVIHTPLQSAYTSDPWDLKINEKIEKSWVMKKDFKPIYSKLTTYKGLLRFGDLPKKRKATYEKLKQEKRNVVYESEMESENKKDISLLDNLTNQLVGGTLLKDDIIKLCQLHPQLHYDNIIAGLNKRLKRNGDEHRSSHYFKVNAGEISKPINTKSNGISSNTFNRVKTKLFGYQ